MTRREQVSKEGLKDLGDGGLSTDKLPPWHVKQPCWASPGLSPGGLRGRPSTVCPPILVKQWGMREEVSQRNCQGPSSHTCPHAEPHGMQGGPPGSV